MELHAKHVIQPFHIVQLAISAPHLHLLFALHVPLLGIQLDWIICAIIILYLIQTVLLETQLIVQFVRRITLISTFVNLVHQIVQLVSMELFAKHALLIFQYHNIVIGAKI